MAALSGSLRPWIQAVSRSGSFLKASHDPWSQSDTKYLPRESETPGLCTLRSSRKREKKLLNHRCLQPGPKVLPTDKVCYPSDCGSRGDWLPPSHSCSLPSPRRRWCQEGQSLRGRLRAWSLALARGLKKPPLKSECADRMPSGHSTSFKAAFPCRAAVLPSPPSWTPLGDFLPLTWCSGCFPSVLPISRAFGLLRSKMQAHQLRQVPPRGAVTALSKGFFVFLV